MSYTVYIKQEIALSMNDILGVSLTKFNVTSLNVTNGLLKKGDYYIPVEHILFIREV